MKYLDFGIVKTKTGDRLHIKVVMEVSFYSQ